MNFYGAKEKYMRLACCRGDPSRESRERVRKFFFYLTAEKQTAVLSTSCPFMRSFIHEGKIDLPSLLSRVSPPPPCSAACKREKKSSEKISLSLFSMMFLKCNYSTRRNHRHRLFTHGKVNGFAKRENLIFNSKVVAALLSAVTLRNVENV